MHRLIIFYLTIIFFSSTVSAGGVGLGSTRLVYQDGKSQAMIQVRNTHSDSSFLIQSWIDSENSYHTKDFLITPPLFVLKPESESILKIVFNGSSLPQDRESLYWLTVKAIPQLTKQTTSNSLQFAAANRIKVFYRPESLGVIVGEIWKSVNGELINGKISLTNSSSYYLTTINTKVDGNPVKPVMIPPKSTVVLEESFSQVASFSYQTINDYGAWTPINHIKLTIR